MDKICIIGNGNVAVHLCKAFEGKVAGLCKINSRTLDNLPLDADIYILAVSDDAITEVASRLPLVSGVVAHTSGSTPITALDCIKGKTGVFYPFMTFSREAKIDYSKIGVFIEGRDSSVISLLREAATLFTDKIVEMDSSRRQKMHLASIFACNFANALWQVSAEMLEAENIPFDYVLPVIEAATDKLQTMKPMEAQTGPARRGDMKILSKHEDALSYNPRLQYLYHDLSKLIIDQNKNNRLS